MSKFGYIAMITGFVAVMAYSLYIFLIDLEVAMIFKVGTVLVVAGAIIIIFKQVLNRKKEKKEEEEYKDY